MSIPNTGFVSNANGNADLATLFVAQNSTYNIHLTVNAPASYLAMGSPLPLPTVISFNGMPATIQPGYYLVSVNVTFDYSTVNAYWNIIISETITNSMFTFFFTNHNSAGTMSSSAIVYYNLSTLPNFTLSGATVWSQTNLNITLNGGSITMLYLGNTIY
jgi:hypothetical protein